MIGSTISHYKVLEKFGEIPRLPHKPYFGGQANSPTSVVKRVDAILRIPTPFVGSERGNL